MRKSMNPVDKGRGNGRNRNPPFSQFSRTETKFRGANDALPALSYGSSKTDNPILFLEKMGEHVARQYMVGIADIFWTSPPEYGEDREEPTIPEAFAPGNVGKAQLAEYIADHKDWKSDAKKKDEQKKQIFSVVLGQLNEASRCEVKDDEEWDEMFLAKDLQYLIIRIRSTHIARQTGNPLQDQERVRAKWGHMKMEHSETSGMFRKRVEDHQVERESVGLPIIPEEELVIGIINRLDMHRYGTIVQDYLSAARRGYADLPQISSILWKELKDAQILRQRSAPPPSMESIYLSSVEEPTTGRGNGGRGGRGGRSDRGGGRGGGGVGRGGRGGGRGGRGRGRYQSEGTPTASTHTSQSITPGTITCWTCGKSGHIASSCPDKTINYTRNTEETIFLATIRDFHPGDEDSRPADETAVFHTTHSTSYGTLMLDSQSSVHITRDKDLLEEIHDSARPIMIQGITRDKIRVTEEGTIRTLGIKTYHSPHVAANIISLSLLSKTHHCQFEDDKFIATPIFMGPTLIFTNYGGHYTLHLDRAISSFFTTTETRSSHLTKRERQGALRAYEFIIKMGFVSYHKAAEAVQRGSITDLGFTRQDLVHAQQTFGYPAAYQLGHGTQKAKTAGDMHLIPLQACEPQELQVDTFFFLGNAFFISISVLLGLIMVTHLGPGTVPHTTNNNTDKATSGSKAKAGQSLLAHLDTYASKGFKINRVTTDGEPAIRAIKTQLEHRGTELNILGHGSHVPHAESAIRHIKNMARSTLHNLGYPFPSRWTPFLIAFVVFLANMIPKVNSMGSISAYTNFTGRIPSYHVIAPFAFGTPGFLQRPKKTTSNSAESRADYVIWVGTTRSSSGTHRAVSLDTLQVLTGDQFVPAPLTAAAAARLTTLATGQLQPKFSPPESPLPNPSPPQPLDPDRGLDPLPLAPEGGEADTDNMGQAELVTVDTLTNTDDEGPPHTEGEPPLEEDHNEGEPAPTEAPTGTAETAPPDTHNDLPEPDEDENNIAAQVADIAAARRSSRYFLRSTDRHVNTFSAMSTADAIRTFGHEATKKANMEELNNCLQKHVWEPIHGNGLPSKMIVKAKHLPNGLFDRLKSRICGGGHRQHAWMFKDSEISSPTVALTSILATAAIAAHYQHFTMTVDFTAAYLNAEMKGDPVNMLLSPDITALLVEMDPSYKPYVRTDMKVAVRLKKALYGFKQSAMLWFQELSSTLLELGFKKNPYDHCALTRRRGKDIDRILVYVDDLFVTSASEDALADIATALRRKYGGVTSHSGDLHNYLGMQWDFTDKGQVTISMEGYVTEILRKYDVRVRYKTPATDALFTTDNDSPSLPPLKQELFHSAVMTLHYLAKRTRSDILTAVSWCATRVLKPTEEDERKLDRILGYLLATKDQKLVLRIGPTCELRAYVDASFGLYPDGKSITGAVLMLGNAPIYVKSSKQKIVTRSSTESELVGISDTLSQILWAREFLLAQGIHLGPATLYQDNLSTIFLANKGRSTNERTRHIKIRYFFITHYVENKEIKIEYMPTTKMIADILTKSIHGTLFKKLSAAISGRTIL